MEASIIKIGNSQGLIIPKRMLDQLGAERRVEIQVKDGGIFIAPVYNKPRKGWAGLFAKAIKKTGPDADYFEGTENEFDKEEWTW